MRTYVLVQDTSNWGLSRVAAVSLVEQLGMPNDFVGFPPFIKQSLIISRTKHRYLYYDPNLFKHCRTHIDSFDKIICSR